MEHKHQYHWTGGFDLERICYVALCSCGKRIFEVWIKSHYEDEEEHVLPDAIENECV